MKVRTVDGAHNQYSAEAHAAREAVKIYSQGYFAETCQRGAYSAAVAQTSQQVVGTVLGLAKGDVVSGLIAESTVAATADTLAKYALVSLQGVVLAITADGSTAFTAAAGPKPLSFAAAYTAPEDIGVFACHLQVGGTPSPLLRGTGGAAGLGGAAIGGGAQMGFTLAGQADFTLGATLSLAALSSVRHWMAAF